jgi:prevent-host-death family protein
MYIKVGAFDAKAKLSELLREVEQHGQRYTITLRGHPVADLVPTESGIVKNVHAAIEGMRNVRRVQGVSEETIDKWINEGKR